MLGFLKILLPQNCNCHPEFISGSPTIELRCGILKRVQNDSMDAQIFLRMKFSHKGMIISTSLIWTSRSQSPVLHLASNDF